MTDFLKPWLLVGVGGAFGSLLRYYAAVAFGARPSTTFAVNIAGSLLIGILAAMAPDERIRLALGTGFLGGFTTFSAWQLEAYTAARTDTGSKHAALILLGSMICGFGACWAGHLLGARFTSGSR